MSLAEATAIFIVFSTGFTGNAILIFILVSQVPVWTTTMRYLFNLALSDFLFVSVMPLWGRYYLNGLDWTFGSLVGCKLTATITQLNMFASILFLTAISIDRWLMVVKATESHRWRTPSVSKMSCVVIWVIATGLSIPVTIFQTLVLHDRNTTHANSTNFTNQTQQFNPDALTLATTSPPRWPPDAVAPTVTYCAFVIDSRIAMGLHGVIKSVLGFFLPVAVITFSYVHVVITVRKKTIGDRKPVGRVTKLAVAVIVGFVVCWLPNQILTLHSALGGWWLLYRFDKPLYAQVYPFAVCFAWMNSCLNPILYALTSPKLRQSLVNCCTSQPSQPGVVVRYRMGQSDNTTGTSIIDCTLRPSPSSSHCSDKVELKSTNENGRLLNRPTHV